MPLSQFYGEVARHVEALGATFLLKKGVDTPLQYVDGRWNVALENETVTADNVVLAVPFEQVARLLPPEAEGLSLLTTSVGKFRNAPITTVHFWFDREVADLDHAVLLDTGIQWIFNKTRIRNASTAGGHYLELVISASHPHLKRTRDELLSSAYKELAIFFPKVNEATILKSGILKEARATFSVTPGLDQYRPAQRTALPGLFLAGDWTQTGWPSTMEGGVRSGYLAAEAITGSPGRFLRGDLPATGLMPWIVRR